MTEEETRADGRPWLMSRGYAWLLAAPALFLLVFFLWPLARVVVRGSALLSRGIWIIRMTGVAILARRIGGVIGVLVRVVSVACR